MRRIRAAIVSMVLGVSLIAVPGGASAEEPVGSDVRLTFPTGDIHVDHGAPDTPELRRAADVTAARVAWPADRLVVEMTMVGVPSVDPSLGYSVTAYLSDRATASHRTWILRWDGRAVTLRDTRTFSLLSCGQSGTVTGTTLRMEAPSACFGDADTLATALNAGWSTFTDADDYLIGGDVALEETFYELVANRSGTAVDTPSGGGGGSAPGGTSARDRDASPSRVVVDDARGDAGTGPDLLGVDVDALSNGDLRVTVEFASADPALEFWVKLRDDDFRGFEVRHGQYGTSARYERADEWGHRTCSSSIQRSGATYVLTARGCHRYTAVDRLTVNVYPSSGAFPNDTLFADISFAKTVPARPATAGRDVSATCDGRAPQTRFSDTSGNVHAAMIDCLSHYGITQGKGGGQYGTKDPLTRGQVATFLKKTVEAAGRTLPAGDGSCAGVVHGDSLDALVAAGIVESEGCDLNRRMTRAEMAEATAAAAAWAGVAPASPANSFADDEHMGADQRAHDVIASMGVVTGKAQGLFGPGDGLRRDQMATFLARLLDALRS